MENNNGYVMIPVSRETRDRFKTLTPKAFTYDEMISRLLDLWEHLPPNTITLRQDLTDHGKSTKDNKTS